jgi:trigger factor
MTEQTCRRELELEIPAEEVRKAQEKVVRDFAKIARIPGFRPGKAPATLIRKRFSEDIQGEIMQTLAPQYLEKAITEQKLMPVTRPQVEDIRFTEGGPLKFRASFEVLPEFTLGEYKNLEVQVEDLEIGEAQLDRAIEEAREQAATFAPVEGRNAADGDYVMMRLTGTPAGGGAPVDADNIVCHVGAEETLEAFTENLRGAAAGESRRFDAKYPEDYPDPKLAGRSYTYTAEIRSIKEKRLAELNDEFAKDLAGEQGVQTLAQLREKVREKLEAAREQRKQAQTQDKIMEALVKSHDFPVPEALVEHQMDSRLEQAVRSLAAQGVDPRGVNVDWVALRRRQRERAVNDVKAELLLDHIAEAEKIEVSEEELTKEIEHIAGHSGESAEVLRARLTKQGALDTMKSKLRSNKTLEWLCGSARVQTSKPA